MTAVADGTPAVVEVAELRKRYDGRPVLRGLSFRIAAGEIFGLLGPNGAGKTTTVEILEGYRRPDGGTVRVLGVDPVRAGRDHRARVGLMLQGGGGIDPRMTAREVVALHGRFHADPLDPDQLLAEVGLSGAVRATRYRRLSGGERQRVGLAVALVGRPDLLVLDEPTAGMDVEARAATRDLLGRLRGQGVTILLTSHDLADVERLADRLAIVDRGRIAAIGRPDELAPAVPVLRFLLGTALTEPDRALLEAALAAGRPLRLRADDGPARYRVDGIVPDPAAIATIAAWCAARGALIVELRTSGGSLEERYLDVLGSLGPDGDDGEDAGDETPAVAGSGGRRRRR